MRRRPHSAVCIPRLTEEPTLTFLPHQAGSIIVKQIGHAVLTVTPSDGGAPETYLLTLPRLRIDGLWYGSPYIELTDTTYIIGGGHTSTIEFKGKGYFSGKSHSFKSVTTPLPGQGGQGPAETIVEGTWHENSKFSKGGAGVFHEVHEHKEEVVPFEYVEGKDMGEFETRKLWNLVAKGIREGDFELASKEKSRIEASIYIYNSCSLAEPLLSSHRTSKGRCEKTSKLQARPGRCVTLHTRRATLFVSMDSFLYQMLAHLYS